MAISKYLRKVKTAVSESAHNNGLKRVKENEVKKELGKICEPQPKKERQVMVITKSLNKKKFQCGVLSIT